MKPIFHLLILFFLGVSINSFSQAFPENDVTWQGVTYGIAGPVPYRQALCGDTLINGQSYNKLYSYYYTIEGELIEEYFAGTRVSGPRVWCLESGATEEKLLYDFSLEAGDQITLEYIGLPGGVTIKVAEVSTIDVGGHDVKVLHFVPTQGIEESWIEGIGSTKGPLFRAFTAIDANSNLNCFRREGDLTYRTVPENECNFTNNCHVINSLNGEPNSSPYVLFPTIISNEFQLVNPNDNRVELEIFSAEGQMVKAYPQLSKGMHQLSIGNLPSGFYFATLRESNKNIYLQHFKIILE
ncbi:MAG: T9SS type A sorting domain-containing protein [Chitinophagales bacterium]|nr:T9SS type A sorting domain-containing protein [Chitinophagales bacterium]